MDDLIKKRIAKYSNDIKNFFEKIKEFDRIAIFRHDHPDYDALGTQMALYHFLKDNFPKKEIIYVGDNHVTLSGNCFPKMQEIEDAWFEKPFLGIVVDLSTLDRVADSRLYKAKLTIKIDHHPDVDKYGDIQIVDPSMIAAGELVASMLFTQDKLKIGKECAKNLFKAIVGDSGRFLYQETSSLTFLIAQKLLETGVILSNIYSEMYDEDIIQLAVRKYILKTYKVTEHGVAYYVLSDKMLKKFGLTPIQGKDNINLFSHFKEINAWLSITEDKAKGHWRVSIRSAKKPIDKIAENFGGGGHPQASATKLSTRKEINELIKTLDNAFKEGK